MMRLLPTILLVSLAMGCTFTPPGECQSAEDCVFGARCETGVCVMGCDADEHCAGDWERCESSTRRCALREGRCSSQAQCETWELCGEGHTCETSPNLCAEESDCGGHEDCNLSTHLCQLQEGRCNSVEDCGYGATPWASCDGASYCTYAPADDVMMWGTLSEGACYRDAVSPVEFPERAKAGFGCYTGIFNNEYAVLLPSGGIVYFEKGGTTSRLRIFTPDRFTWREASEYWEYPISPYDNDPIVPTPGCGEGSPYSVVVQAGTSRILYTCLGSANDWYDTAGNLLVTGWVQAWNQDGLFLRGLTSLEVVDATGASTPVTGLPASFGFLDARADGSGFWIALAKDPDDSPERWRVDAAGVATRQVVYADPPSEAPAESYSGLLSRSGALYQSVYTNGPLGDTVVRRSADGSTAAIVYSEGDMPEGSNDFSERTLRLYTLMHISYLFAGP